MFGIIVDGYNDLVSRARERGIEVLIENHWGPSVVPENVVRILNAIDGLGLLLDSHNWAPGMQQNGWRLCAPYARSTHFKTFRFDDSGNDVTVDVPLVVRILRDSGYDGCWGVESVPEDGDEYGAVEKTIALIRRGVAG